MLDDVIRQVDHAVVTAGEKTQDFTQQLRVIHGSRFAPNRSGKQKAKDRARAKSAKQARRRNRR